MFSYFPVFLSVDNELNGQIPIEIGSLRALRYLSLSMYYQSVKCLCLVLYFDLHSCSDSLVSWCDIEQKQIN